MSSRKPSSRNNSRYWRKRGQVRPVSPLGGGANGGLLSPISSSGNIVT